MPRCKACKGTGLLECPLCHGLGHIDKRKCQLCKGKGYVSCNYCKGTAVMRSGDDDRYIKVEGHDSGEVERVAISMMEKAGITRKKIRPNPWVSGSFYFAVFLVALATLLVVSKMVPVITLPIILICAIIALSIIGSFQLRNDDQLSQKNFLHLMILCFKYLPWIRHTSADKIDNETNTKK